MVAKQAKNFLQISLQEWRHNIMEQEQLKWLMVEYKVKFKMTYQTVSETEAIDMA